MIEGARILITGGTGSLGQALAKEMIQRNELPQKLYLLGKCPQRSKAIREGFPWPKEVQFFVKCIRDYEDMKDACCGVDLVIHAAANKLVDIGAYESRELLKTNVIGTDVILRAAAARGVKKVLLVSSDKSVSPTNIYGFSKGMAEYLTIHSNSYSAPRGTIASVVRYGNVLGSRGSVTWLWKKQLAAGRPAEITDFRMTRFIITFQQAYNLIQYALKTMEGGEIFVPELPSIGLWDYAQAMDISGNDRVKIIGHRPGGEKVHEVLWNPEEGTRMVVKDHLIIYPSFRSWTDKPLPEPMGPATASRRSDEAPKISVEQMRALIANNHPKEEP